MDTRGMRLLSEDEAAGLRRQPFTYPEVGATRGPAPLGYRLFEDRWELTRVDFVTAAERLMAWQVQERSGLTVLASTPRVQEGAVVDLRVMPWLGPLGVHAVCRVVYVVDTPTERGFAYGSLPGHPVSGEELFLLEHLGAGPVTFTIRSFSRPGTRLAALGEPFLRLGQRVMTARYAKAVRAVMPGSGRAQG